MTNDDYQHQEEVEECERASKAGYAQAIADIVAWLRAEGFTRAPDHLESGADVDRLLRSTAREPGMRMDREEHAMANKPRLTCGCTANAVRIMPDDLRVPCCAIHDCMEIDTNPPDLTGRMAECDCGRRRRSNDKLPFFQYRKNEPVDRYYCGCQGWN